MLAIFFEALGSLLGWVDVLVVGPSLYANVLNLSLRDVGLVLREVVRAERVVVAAVVAHDFVGQRVEIPRRTWELPARAPMPVPRHPPIATLDASSLGVDVRKILVEADGTVLLLVGGLGTRAVLARGLRAAH